MNPRKLFGISRHTVVVDYALLFVRLYMGIAFVQHGWTKIQNPAGWAGDGFPAFLQVLAAVAEFGGGVSLILGLLTPLAGLGLICTMAVAIDVHRKMGAVMVGENSWELPGLFLVLALFWILVGPGRFSIDFLLFKYRDGRANLPVEGSGATAL